MIGEHRTLEGEKIPIACMDNGHLINFINMILRKIKKINTSEAKPKLSTREKILYDAFEVDEEDLAEAEKIAWERLFPYLAEALLRVSTQQIDVKAFTPSISECIQRKGAISLTPLPTIPQEFKELNSLVHYDGGYGDDKYDEYPY